MSEKDAPTPRGLSKAILGELERGYLPPYGDDEEWLVQQMIEKFLKRRAAIQKARVTWLKRDL